MAPGLCTALLACFAGSGVSARGAASCATPLLTNFRPASCCCAWPAIPCCAATHSTYVAAPPPCAWNRHLRPTEQACSSVGRHLPPPLHRWTPLMPAAWLRTAAATSPCWQPSARAPRCGPPMASRPTATIPRTRCDAAAAAAATAAAAAAVSGLQRQAGGQLPYHVPGVLLLLLPLLGLLRCCFC